MLARFRHHTRVPVPRSRRDGDSELRNPGSILLAHHQDSGVVADSRRVLTTVGVLAISGIVGFVVGLFSEELPSESAADFVEFVDGAGGAWGAAVVVAVGVAVVGVAFGSGVELAGGAAVGVGVDVVDVALVGGDVAAALVLAVAVADFDSASESADEGALV